MKKNPKFAIVLAGCGVYDGAEIHEATLTMLAIAANGGTYEIFAPNINQHHVINHITGQEMPESRNVLVESARIARGKIQDLDAFDASLFDALMLPGGFGVAKNLSNFAFKGANQEVLPSLEKAIIDMYKAKKPIGALCISPAIVVGVLKGATVTIGQDAETSQYIESMGSHHELTNHGEVIVDKHFNLATTPCYMLDATILDIEQGATQVVKAVLNMIM